jgi:hypothetical protein
LKCIGYKLDFPKGARRAQFVHRYAPQELKKAVDEGEVPLYKAQEILKRANEAAFITFLTKQKYKNQLKDTIKELAEKKEE